MGSILRSESTSLGVWAPNAKQVFVTGDSNHWSQAENPLAAEDNGHWSGNVPGVKAGDEYKLELDWTWSFVRLS